MIHNRLFVIQMSKVRRVKVALSKTYTTTLPNMSDRGIIVQIYIVNMLYIYLEVISTY